MKRIEVKVQMNDGTGFGIFIKVDNNNLFFDRSGSQFVDLSPNSYISTVGGHEPTNASVAISFLQDGNIKGGQEFSTPVFFGFVPFNVN
jgi:hypothetical protein